jgi:hypothetical protein
LRIPKLLSVEEELTPSAKLYAPPDDELVNALVPVVPPALLSVVAALKYAAAPILQPVGHDANDELPIPLKFWVNGELLVILNWACNRPAYN